MRLPLLPLALACPTPHLPQCFDHHFTCERCCDTSKGCRGAGECWVRAVDYETCCGVRPFCDIAKIDL
jgi:hypothetical protein